MHLTKIEIENFKGVGARQSIDLRPITLLFGPNSAGKSTILQALHYLREILERENVDPDATIAGGLIDLGGFATLVHNHELDRTVRFKVLLGLFDEPDVFDYRRGLEYLPLNTGASISAGKPEFDELSINYLVEKDVDDRNSSVVQEVGIEIEIRWSELGQRPYVSRFAVELNGEALAAIISPPQKGHAQLTDFNFAHDLLRRAIPPEDQQEYEAGNTTDSSPLKDAIRILSREMAADHSTSDIPDSQFRMSVPTIFGALPELERELSLDISDPDGRVREMLSIPRDIGLIHSNTPRVIGLQSLLSEMILGPARLVRDYLAEMTYIGPLREIPSREHRPKKIPDAARWAHGLAAWDILYSSDDLMENVNYWLSDKKFQTGYRLERIKFKEIPIPSSIHQMFKRGLDEDDIGELQESYDKLATRTETTLRDFDRGILVTPSDVGVGISQMVPVVVAALCIRKGLLVIEQPELHVHPAIQVSMGDLFIRGAADGRDYLSSEKTLIVETHSEHIMLRLLRRIRETTNDELPPDVTGLTPEELAVIYVENTDEGACFRSLRVDAEGEFLDRWPRGFFGERADELF